MYQKLKELIEGYKTIIIHRHLRPDGDALGSQLGLKEILKTNYPDKEVYAVGDISFKLSFVGNMDRIDDKKYENALAIVVDSSEEHLISDERYKKAKCLVKIDHHIPRSVFGDLQIVDTKYESCAGLIADIAFALGWELNLDSATKLFTGLTTDSGRFKYSSTTPRSYEIAAKLLSYGVDFISIYNRLYIENIKIVKLKAACTLNFQLTRSNVAYLKNTAKDIENYGVDFQTVSRGMVGTMAGIEGIDVWVNFTEDAENNCVAAEIRSNSYNINQVAVKYGGGGHLNASGASLKNFDEADMMLEDLNKLVEGRYGD